VRSIRRSMLRYKIRKSHPSFNHRERRTAFRVAWQKAQKKTKESS